MKISSFENIQNTESGSYCVISDNESSSVTLECQKIILKFHEFYSGQSISKIFQIKSGVVKVNDVVH